MIPKYQSSDVKVVTLADVPSEEHWVILTFSRIHIPGDERSRTNPGHGYPAEDKDIVIYNAYLTEQKWKEQINYLESQNSSSYLKTHYSAFKATPAKISTSITVIVN